MSKYSSASSFNQLQCKKKTPQSQEEPVKSWKSDDCSYRVISVPRPKVSPRGSSAIEKPSAFALVSNIH